MRQGGSANRPGTRFVGESKNSIRQCRLIDFTFNEGQAYALEVGHLYIRVIFQGAYITEDPKFITGITQATPGVFSSIAHGFSVGDELFIDEVQGMVEVNNRNWRVASVPTTSTFTLEYLDGTPLDTTSFTAWTSDGEAHRIFTITSTYDEADLFRLKYFQSADVMTILKKNYAPRELRRTSHTTWTLLTQSLAPAISAPTGLSGGGGGTFNAYVVTSIDANTAEESLASSQTLCGSVAPSTGVPITLNWNANSSAGKYGVYRRFNGIFYFLNFAGSNTFLDDGIIPAFDRTPPTAFNPFNGSDNWPDTGAYVQSRLFMGNLTSNTEIIHGSRIGYFRNFSKSDPIGDDSRVSFQLPGRTVNEVRHLIDLKKMVVLTSNGEWSCSGNAAGIIVPGQVGPTQHGYNGSSHLRPIIIGETIIYVQAEGSKIRDLLFAFESQGYTGDDISTWGAHLVDNHTIIDWAHQKEPHSIIWAIREDGIVIGITYVREQGLVAFHRHDFDGGLAESVCSIPENGKWVVYFVINREIDGRTVRYIEKMTDRFPTEVEDYIFLDSSLTYDGWNTDTTHNLKIANGSMWLSSETLDLVSNAVYFESSDVGRTIFLRDEDDVISMFKIDTFVSSVLVRGKTEENVPVSLQNVEVTDWASAITTVEGLHHLEGEEVGVFADAFVVASPNNASVGGLTVADGSITLDRPYAKIHVGKAILSDTYTLDIDTVQGETLANKQKLVSEVTIHVADTRGVWVGPKPPEDDEDDPQQGLLEKKIRETEQMNDPVSLASGAIEVPIYAEWNSNGSVFIRQIDPVPLQILAIAPTGLIPYRQFGSR